jgi:hypothetical protein
MWAEPRNRFALDIRINGVIQAAPNQNPHVTGNDAIGRDEGFEAGVLFA